MDKSKFARVTFRYKAETVIGDCIKIIGDCEELGNWNIVNAIKLSTDKESYPEWYTLVPISLPFETDIEYKYVFINNGRVRWESIPGNRKIRCTDKEITIEDEEKSVISRHIINHTELSPAKNIGYQSPSIQLDDAVQFMPNDNLIIVSMSLPIKVIRNPDYCPDNPRESKWIFKNYQGLWMPVLYSIARSQGIRFKWIGWPHIHIDNEAEQEEIAEILLYEYDCIPLFIPEEIFDKHILFCSHVLFPLFSNIIDTAPENVPQYTRDLWEAYRNVNSRFADKVMEIYVNELIWIHDYQLLLTPSFVSRRTRDVLNIGLYLHIPFPSSEVYRVLPHREAILHGMLCCDLIGFHLFEYARHFITCCKRLLGVDHQFTKGGYLGLNYYGRHIMLRIGHLGVEPSLIRQVQRAEEYQNTLINLRKKYAGKRVILGIDPLNRLSGIILKFNSFRNVLQNMQRNKDNVVLVQICTPAKHCNPKDVDQVRTEVYELKDTINTEIGESVIEIIEQDVSCEVRYAYMEISIGVVVSTIRDGLCLIPFEYLIINEDRDAHIVVSEFAGVSRALSSPTKVNPFDLNDMESALYFMITQQKNPANYPKKQRDLEFVKNHTTFEWAQNFLADLKRASKDVRNYQYVTHGLGDKLKLIALNKRFSKLAPDDVLKAYKNSRNRVMFFDNEGTLSNYIKQADINKTAGPSDKILNSLDTLCTDDRNTVFVITGRERFILDRWFSSIKNLGMAAEYGCFVKWNSKVDWEHEIRGSGMWKDTAIDIINAYVTRTEGAYLEVKESSVVFQFRNADPDYGTWQAKELMSHLEILLRPFMDECEVSSGMGYVEVKPRGINKGNTIYRLMEQVYQRKGPIDFLICVGDDVSDEEMFKTVKMLIKEESQIISPSNNFKHFCCTVGRKPSLADHYINDTHELLHLIEILKCWTDKSKRNFSYGDLSNLLFKSMSTNMKMVDFSGRSFHKKKTCEAMIPEQFEEDGILSPTEVYKPSKRKSLNFKR